MKRLPIILAALLCGGAYAQTEPLTLDACLRLAQENNKALAAAERQAQAAQFDLRSMKGNFFPSLSAAGVGLYSTSDGRLDIAGGSLPVLDKNGVPTGSTAYFPGLGLDYSLGWIYGGGVTLEQPLYMGGKVRTGYRMARIGSSLAAENRRLTEAEVIVETSRAYAGVVRAREIRRVAESYRRLLAELLRSVESARRHGIQPQNDVLKVRVKFNESELDLRRAENALRLATMNLCHYIGCPLGTPLDVAGRPAEPPAAAAPGTGDMTARPEYRMLCREERPWPRTDAAGPQRTAPADRAGRQLRLPARTRGERAEPAGQLGILRRHTAFRADLPFRNPLEQVPLGPGQIRAGAGRAGERRRAAGARNDAGRPTTSTRRCSNGAWPTPRWRPPRRTSA